MQNTQTPIINDMAIDFDTKRHCPNYDACPIIEHFSPNKSALFKEIYCFGAYETCARHERKAAGEEVPPNLLPHGKRLRR